MIEFLSHFHPVIVHLPIGFLLVALLLQYLARKEKYSALKIAIPIVLLWGAFAAIAACVTGYLLSIGDDYDRSLVNWHMWMAIGVVLVSLILYTKEVNPRVEVSKKFLSVTLFFLIMLTGHFGGSLTHGSDYLSKPFFKIFSADTVINAAIKPIADVQQALVYHDVIQPILQTRCYSCHNENKQKGKLRMDDIALLMKGGKNGSIINLYDADSSEMLRRLLLPIDNDKHMPPKEKPQPTEAQIALLHWWISNKADFNVRVKELEQTEKIKSALVALQKPVTDKKESLFIPSSPVEKANDETIVLLRKKGWLILPVSQNSNYLAATFTKANSLTNESLQELSKLSKQLIYLKINDNTLDEAALKMISKFSNVSRLNLANTGLRDNTIGQLASMKNVQQLNLVGTNITVRGLTALKNLQGLSSLYLYRSAININDMGILRATFPGTTIDFGNYIVPLLESDTMLVKPPTVR